MTAVLPPVPAFAGAGGIHPRMAWIYGRAEPMLG